MRTILTLALALIGGAATPLAAQTGAAILLRNDRAAIESAYWTADRLQGARAYAIPRGPGGTMAAEAQPATVPSQSSRAKRPTYTGPKLNVRLHPALPLASAAEAATPLAAGLAGLRFTNERVVPMHVLRNVYPWMAVGKLFFTGADGGDYVCSGSVVKQRVVATAGHCVYDATRKQFHRNFLFVPGYDNGATPFGAFGWTVAATTQSWAAGQGAVPNAADFGMIVAADKVVGGQPRRIGELVGWLGWKTQALLGNSVSAMGYPCNLDACRILQRTSAQVNRRAEPNSAEIGSDHRGGASGGPWVQDWGGAAVGQPGRELAGNVLVGVTSYGPVDLGWRFLGSSILNAEWVAVWSRVCAEPRACG